MTYIMSLQLQNDSSAGASREDFVQEDLTDVFATAAAPGRLHRVAANVSVASSRDSSRVRYRRVC